MCFAFMTTMLFFGLLLTLTLSSSYGGSMPTWVENLQNNSSVRYLFYTFLGAGFVVPLIGLGFVGLDKPTTAPVVVPVKPGQRVVQQVTTTVVQTPTAGVLTPIQRRRAAELSHRHSVSFVLFGLGCLFALYLFFRNGPQVVVTRTYITKKSPVTIW